MTNNDCGQEPLSSVQLKVRFDTDFSGFGVETPFSIWRKIQSKRISLEQITDIVGFRVILDNTDMCYRALGIFHTKWSMVPGRFKDYISVPKSNNYKSIHTSVIGPKRQKIEIQIRTQEMHEFAERGVAAHWNYKANEKVSDNTLKDYNWSPMFFQSPLEKILFLQL